MVFLLIFAQKPQFNDAPQWQEMASAEAVLKEENREPL